MVSPVAGSGCFCATHQKRHRMKGIRMQDRDKEAEREKTGGKKGREKESGRKRINRETLG